MDDEVLERLIEALNRLADELARSRELLEQEETPPKE
jgi:hypothetical protein